MAEVEARRFQADEARQNDGRQAQKQERRTAEIEAGGSLVEAVGGAGAAVLAILGLTGIFPVYMVAIASIALGAGLIFQSAGIAARYSKLLEETTETEYSRAELGGGMSGEFLGGAAGIALGILGLLGIIPAVLLPIAVLVYGGTLLLACGSTAGLNSLVVERRWRANHSARRIATQMVSASNSAQALVAVGAVVLGILALVGLSWLTLSLVGLLALGSAMTLSSSAISGKMITMLHH